MSANIKFNLYIKLQKELKKGIVLEKAMQEQYRELYQEVLAGEKELSFLYNKSVKVWFKLYGASIKKKRGIFLEFPLLFLQMITEFINVFIWNI